MTTFSKKQHNYSYAPGLATYGIDGKSGAQGNSGNNIFYTSYNMTSSTNDILYFARAIAALKLPVGGKITYLDRKYQNGDIFIDTNGTLIEITDIDNLIKATTIINVKKYYSIKGTIKNVRNSSINVYSNYAYLNAGGYGLILADLINNDIKSKGITESYAYYIGTLGMPVLQMVSNNDNDTGKINFINLNTVSGLSNSIDLNIYYDKNEKAYHIDSSYPIIMDSNLFVKYNTTKETISDYSKVVTNERNSLTHFYGYSKQIKYQLDPSIYAYTNLNDSTKYYGTVYKITLIGDEDILTTLYESNHTKTLHILKGTYQDFQNIIENRDTYYFKQELNYINPIDASDYVADTSDNIQISLINNVEIYLQKN